MLKFREKVLVNMPAGQIEGYVFAVVSGGNEVYVILTGHNTKPILVSSSDVVSLDVPPPKRGRGRPRKGEK
jgi:hypothetical protein